MQRRIDVSRVRPNDAINDYVIEVAFGLEASSEDVAKYISVLKKNLYTKVKQLCALEAEVRVAV